MQKWVFLKITHRIWTAALRLKCNNYLLCWCLNLSIGFKYKVLVSFCCFVWDKSVMCVPCAFHSWYDLFAVIEVYKNTFGINTIYKSCEKSLCLIRDSITVISERKFLFSLKQIYSCAYWLFSANILKIWLERYLL